MIQDYSQTPPVTELDCPEAFVWRFDGPEHVQVWAERKPLVCTAASRRALAGSDFHGTRNFEEATKLIRYGWPEGASIMTAENSMMSTWLAKHAQRDRWVCDVVGESVDIGRWQSGEPECWNTRRMDAGRRAGRKFIHIVVNVSVNCAVSADEVIKRATHLIGFAGGLELLGYRMKVTAVATVSEQTMGRGKLLQLIVPVKHYNERLEPQTTAYVLGHPSFLRRQLLGVMEQLPDDLRLTFGIGRTYGFATKEASKLGVEDAHLVFNMESNDWKPETFAKRLSDAGFTMFKELV